LKIGPQFCVGSDNSCRVKISL